MSGHRRFAEIRDNSPELQAEVETEMRAVRISVELVRLRQAMGLSQHQLADCMSVAQETVSQLENAHDLRLSSITSYVTALGGEVRAGDPFPGP
ncbi:MAG TPA: helix-turn-helix domain-containing protein [Chloroflexota bacterium]|nr:helix-turn-helix domain-containing protein [Chloroflexota bacterium]